jgi:hypothetical protein
MKSKEITDRPYVFRLGQQDSEAALFAQRALRKIGFSSVEEVCFLDAQIDFDCLSALVDGERRYFKYSFDAESPFFANEFNILKQLSPFAPVAFRHGKIKYGDSMQYIITSLESAETVSEFGVSSILEHKDSFLYSFEQLRAVSVDRNFSHHISDIFDRCDLEKFPEHSIEAIKDYSDINALRSIFAILKNEILHLSRSRFCKNSEFCHGNLHPRNILIKNNLFKFQHLHGGCMGNQLFDLSYLFINMGLPLEHQRQLAQDYKCQLPDFDLDEFIEEYNHCYNLTLRLFVYESIFHYLCEIYLHENARPAKILGIASSFLRNEKALSMIPSLNQYTSFLIRDIMEPLIGSSENNADTY